MKEYEQSPIQLQHPEWYLEALIGAEQLRDAGDIDGAERVLFQVNQALAIFIGSGLPTMGEEGSTQVRELRGEMER